VKHAAALFLLCLSACLLRFDLSDPATLPSGQSGATGPSGEQSSMSGQASATDARVAIDDARAVFPVALGDVYAATSEGIVRCTAGAGESHCEGVDHLSTNTQPDSLSGQAVVVGFSDTGDPRCLLFYTTRGVGCIDTVEHHATRYFERSLSVSGAIVGGGPGRLLWLDAAPFVCELSDSPATAATLACTSVPGLSLPAPPVAAVALGGGGTAFGDVRGNVTVFSAGALNAITMPPALVVTSLAADAHALYIGTDAGLYATPLPVDRAATVGLVSGAPTTAVRQLFVVKGVAYGVFAPDGDVYALGTR
jgi:hypothetical protein